MTELSMLWREYFKAKSELEKEDILKKICPGITSEGLEMMKRKMPVPGEQGEPEKGFTELLREAHTTEDLTQKEAIYEKIVEQEKKRVEQELFDRWSDTVDREEYIQLTMQLFPKVSKARAEAMADELDL